MAELRSLWCVRHGQSEWNLAKRLQGQQAHPKLTERGVRQAYEAAQELGSALPQGPITVLSSDLTRAAQTARIIGAWLQDQHSGRQVTWLFSHVLREQAYGDLEGRFTHELKALPTPPGKHITDIAWGKGGESIADVHKRLTAGLPQLLQLVHPHAEIVVVSHGDALRTLQAVAAGKAAHEVSWDSWQNGEVKHLHLSSHSASVLQ